MGRQSKVPAKPLVEKKPCVRCNVYQSLKTAYYTADEILFPDGRFHLCRTCVEEIINERGFNGFILILRTMNKPFLQEAYKDNWKDYIRLINSLPQYKNLTFDHSVFENKNRNIETSSNNTNNDGTLLEIDPKDDPTYYNSKWMGSYTKADIDYLETYYVGLDRDFKIVTTNHKDYAKKICKASLHMDKCFQDMLNDVSGADKRYKDAKDVFDTLSKSAQFSESQRGQNDAGLGCFGVTFDQVEQNKWIPKHTPLDEDAYDKMLRQFSTIKESV